MKKASLLLAFLSLAAPAHGHECRPGPWSHPFEVSVVGAYNLQFCDDRPWTSPCDLDHLVAERGAEMQAVWDADTVAFVTVLGYDTAARTRLMIVFADGTRHVLFDPGPWGLFSRGWLPGGPDPIDVAALLASLGREGETFSLAVGPHVMDAANTHRIEGHEDQFLLAYNDGGLGAGDGDANEPLLLVSGPRDVLTAPSLIPRQEVFPQVLSGPYFCPDGHNVIVGTDVADVLVGTPEGDCIFGLSGDDLIWGRGGDDRILGGLGRVLLIGGRGDDVIGGGACDDAIHGGPGDDDLLGLEGDDAIRGGRGDDLLLGGADDDDLRGGSGLDLMNGGPGEDRLRGGRDRDEMWGAADSDRLWGGPGDDLLWGGHDFDVLRAGRGEDQLSDGDPPRMPNGAVQFVEDPPDDKRGGPGADTCVVLCDPADPACLNPHGWTLAECR